MILQKKLLLHLAVTGMAASLFFGCGDKGASSFRTGNDEGNYAFREGSEFSGGSDTAFDRSHGGMLGGMGSLVDLTADQKARIKSILEKYRPSRDNRGPDGKAAREALRDSVKNAIRAVLTDSQKALLDTIRAQLKAGIVPDTIVKKRVERLTKLLTLTVDQQAQAFTILKQDMQEKLQARIADSSKGDSSATYEKRRHRERLGGMGPFGLSTAFISILTDDQKQILERKKLAHGNRGEGRHGHEAHERR
jgi:hypothetical protein